MFLRYFSTLYDTTCVKRETDLRFMNYFDLVDHHKTNYSFIKLKLKLKIKLIFLTLFLRKNPKIDNKKGN